MANQPIDTLVNLLERSGWSKFYDSTPIHGAPNRMERAVFNVYKENEEGEALEGFLIGVPDNYGGENNFVISCWDFQRGDNKWQVTFEQVPLKQIVDFMRSYKGCVK
jgi:hypothetical protein